MRLLTSAAALVAIGAAALSAPLGAAPAAKPRMVSSPPAQTGTRWVGVLAAPRPLAVSARLGRRSLRVAVRRLRPGRYQLRAVFPVAGRWTLWTGTSRLGSVFVRPRRSA